MNLVKYDEACAQGPRPEMQDIVLTQETADQAYYLGVFDGHNPGGEFIAGQVARLTNELAINGRQGMGATDRAVEAASHWAELHEDLKRERPGARAGTTATLAVIKANEVAMAYVGDSQAAFYPDSKGAVDLIKPHNGSNYSERERVGSLGYTIEEIGNTLYFGGRLAVSRAIGDFDCGFVIPQADFTVYRFREPGTLVVGSDGIWGHKATDAQAVEAIVRSHRPRATQATADHLVKLGERNGDNASAIVARIE